MVVAVGGVVDQLSQTFDTMASFVIKKDNFPLHLSHIRKDSWFFSIFKFILLPSYTYIMCLITYYIHVYTIIYNLIHVCNVFENEVMVYTEFWDNQGYVEKVSRKAKQEGKWGRQSGVFFPSLGPPPSPSPPKSSRHDCFWKHVLCCPGALWVPGMWALEALGHTGDVLTSTISMGHTRKGWLLFLSVESSRKFKPPLISPVWWEVLSTWPGDLERKAK